MKERRPPNPFPLRWFAANEFRVLRFRNHEVLPNLEGVMTVPAQALRAERAS